MGATDRRLVDKALDTYVDWREESTSVSDAYRSWADHRDVDSPLRYAAYVAALEREQQACEAYVRALARVSGQRRSARPTGSHVRHGSPVRRAQRG